MGVKTIWDGKDLPPVGCLVYIKLASCGMQIYEVAGYEVRKSVIETERHLGSFIVNINVCRPGDKSVINQRFLDEVYPLDYKE